MILSQVKNAKLKGSLQCYLSVKNTRVCMEMYGRFVCFLDSRLTKKLVGAPLYF